MVEGLARGGHVARQARRGDEELGLLEGDGDRVVLHGGEEQALRRALLLGDDEVEAPRVAPGEEEGAGEDEGQEAAVVVLGGEGQAHFGELVQDERLRVVLLPSGGSGRGAWPGWASASRGPCRTRRRCGRRAGASPRGASSPSGPRITTAVPGGTAAGSSSEGAERRATTTRPSSVCVRDSSARGATLTPWSAASERRRSVPSRLGAYLITRKMGRAPWSWAYCGTPPRRCPWGKWRRRKESGRSGARWRRRRARVEKLRTAAIHFCLHSPVPHIQHLSLHTLLPGKKGRGAAGRPPPLRGVDGM